MIFQGGAQRGQILTGASGRERWAVGRMSQGGTVVGPAVAGGGAEVETGPLRSMGFHE